MKHRFPFLFYLLILCFVPAACTVQSETEPGALGPTEAVSTAVLPTAEPTITAEPIEPTATTEAARPTPTTQPEPTEVALEPLNVCADFPRPAMFILLPDESYALFNPESGESCPLPLLNTMPGMAVVAQKDFFVAIPTQGGEGNATIIMHYFGDGTFDDMDYTAVNTEVGAMLTGFTVSDDGRLIAWSSLGPSAGTDFPSISLNIANTETGEMLGGLTPEADEAPRAFEPIRFSQDGSILYYALQPYGLGGRWTSFNARYDNLYALPTDGQSQPELIFDCAELGFGLCLGDFTVYDNNVTSLAYVDRDANTIVVQNGAGEVLNTFEMEGDYIGFPTFGPSGEFVYFTADITEDPNAVNAAEMGRLHRAAPVTTPSEILAADPGLLLPVTFFNDHQIIVQWAVGDDLSRLALIGMDGTVQMVDLPSGTTVLGIATTSTLIN